MSLCGLAPLYRQREFHQSPLWRILVDHGEEFLKTYDSRYEDSHGPLPKESDKVIYRLVRCGDPHYGLSLLHCPDCKVHMAVPSDDYLRLKPVGDFYLVQAQLRNLDTQANGLDAARVKSMIPLTVVLEILEKPEILDENETGKIRIKAGYRLGTHAVKFTPRVFAQLDMTGGQLLNPADKLQQATADIGLIVFNDLTLSPNSQKVDVHLTGIFKELVFGSAGLIETPSDFVIEGKLKVTVNSGAGSGGTTPVTATVRKGKAPLASAPVTFEVVSGGGTISTTATTNAQGTVTETYGASTQSSSTVQASTSNGSQTASSTVTFNSGYVVDPALKDFYGIWAAGDYYNLADANYQFSGDWSAADINLWRSYHGRAQIGVTTLNDTYTFAGYSNIDFDFHPAGYDDLRWPFNIRGDQQGQGQDDGSGSQYYTSPILHLPNGNLGVEGTWTVNGNPHVQIEVEFPQIRVWDPDQPAAAHDPSNNAKVTIHYHYLGNLVVSFELPIFHQLPSGAL